MWPERALDAWSTLERDAIRSQRSRTRILEGPGGKAAPLWPFAHVLWAAADVLRLGARPAIGDLEAALGRYRSGDAYAAAPRGKRYFDDNAWLGLAMLRLGDTTGEPAWRWRAVELARFVVQGEHPDGGVRWAERSPSRNACSTASGAWLLLAGDAPDATGRATRLMDWLDATLLGSDGLYADRIENGTIEPTRWTYNQGAALATQRRLGRPSEPLRAAILAHWPAERLWTEPPAFAAIAYRALREAHDDRAIVDATWDPYLERLTRDGRDPDSGWYVAGGVGSYDGRPTIDQAAVAEMFALRAADPISPDVHR